MILGFCLFSSRQTIARLLLHAYDEPTSCAELKRFVRYTPRGGFRERVIRLTSRKLMVESKLRLLSVHVSLASESAIEKNWSF